MCTASQVVNHLRNICLSLGGRCCGVPCMAVWWRRPGDMQRRLPTSLAQAGRNVAAFGCAIGDSGNAGGGLGARHGSEWLGRLVPSVSVGVVCHSIVVAGALGACGGEGPRGAHRGHIYNVTVFCDANKQEL